MNRIEELISREIVGEDPLFINNLYLTPSIVASLKGIKYPNFNYIEFKGTVTSVSKERFYTRLYLEKRYLLLGD